MSAYLRVSEVLAVHRVMIDLYGGLYGIRDPGALESAVNRPHNGYYAGVEEEAAALLHSLLFNHPFVDGNKRAAFAACDVFLRLRGRMICGNTAKLHQLVMDWIAASPAERFTRICADVRGVIYDVP